MNHRPKALIADDGPLWQQVISQILEREYDVVAVVGDGRYVLETARLTQLDLITLDVSMPGISGLMLLPALRKTFPEATIIVVTTKNSDVYVDESYARGADGYVAKAKVMTDLLPAIGSASTRRAFRQQSRRA